MNDEEEEHDNTVQLVTTDGRVIGDDVGKREAGSRSRSWSRVSRGGGGGAGVGVGDGGWLMLKWWKR